MTDKKKLKRTVIVVEKAQEVGDYSCLLEADLVDGVIYIKNIKHSKKSNDR